MTRELIIRDKEIVVHDIEKRRLTHFSPEEALEILKLFSSHKKAIEKEAAKEQKKQDEKPLAYRVMANAGNDYFYHATCSPAFLGDDRPYQTLYAHNIGPYVDKECVHCGECLD
jgi:hypothetical protein